ncbi:MAG: rRNA maturation RNase YbeY [Limnospira sp.]
MELELNIQDYFWRGEDGESPPSPRLGFEAIAPETWEFWFTEWLGQLHPHLPPADGYELSLRLTEDAEMRGFNARYRSLDRPTDVLAFATLEVSYPQSPEMLSSPSCYLGDILISVETAARQARQQGHPLKTELAWLAAHGLLHLLGWDHPDDRSLTRMLDRQTALLQAVNLECGQNFDSNR